MTQINEIISEVVGNIMESTLLCRKCMKSFQEGITFDIGTFNLEKTVTNKTICTKGHILSSLDEQFFSGISLNFETFNCLKNKEVVPMI